MVVFIILFKDSKGVIENSHSKNRQYNDQTKKEKKKTKKIKIKINIVDKNITQKTKDWATYVFISLLSKNYCINICTEIHENIKTVDKKDTRSDK